MGTPQRTVWAIEAHTVAKHKILENYLKAWFPILNKYHGKILYIDGFSGPGRYSGGEPGSPIIALEVARNHRMALHGELSFIFIDKREDRVRNLMDEISHIPLPEHFKVSIHHGQFHEILGKALDKLESEKLPLAPTFAFIDPFGFSWLPFRLVTRLLKYSRCEVFITFMVDSINRFLETPNEATSRQIVDLFGSEEILSIASAAGDRITNLRVFYQKKLKSVAQFVRFFEMRDRDQKIIYYLFFASNHPLGHLKMKEAMWKVDSEGDFRFSDATNPQQVVLFQVDHAARLLGILRDKFGKARKAIGELKKYVQDETAYIDKHLRQSLNYGENNSLISVEQKKISGGRRRAGTFPDDVVVTFN